MKCRSCDAEIAEKAIVCYRCGTPTAGEARVPAPVARPRAAWRVWVLVLLVLAAGFAAWLTYRVLTLP